MLLTEWITPGPCIVATQTVSESWTLFRFWGLQVRLGSMQKNPPPQEGNSTVFTPPMSKFGTTIVFSSRVFYWATVLSDEGQLQKASALLRTTPANHFFNGCWDTNSSEMMTCVFQSRCHFLYKWFLVLRCIRESFAYDTIPCIHSKFLFFKTF